jgi:hypothetical protein
MPSDWLELAKKYAANATPAQSGSVTPAAGKRTVPKATDQAAMVAVEVKPMQAAGIASVSEVQPRSQPVEKGSTSQPLRLMIPEKPVAMLAVDRPDGAGLKTNDKDTWQKAAELLECLRAVIDPIPTMRGDAQRLCERLDIDKVLLSRVLAALRCECPLDGLARLPGPLPLGRLVSNAFSARMIDDTLHHCCRVAILNFSKLIKAKAKDRSGMEAALRTPGASPSFELTRKQAAFRAISQLWGYQARCVYVFGVVDTGPAIVSIQGVSTLRAGMAPVILADASEGDALLQPFCSGIDQSNQRCTLVAQDATCTYRLPAEWPVNVPVQTPALAAIIEVMLPPGRTHPPTLRTFDSLRPGVQRELDIRERWTVHSLNDDVLSKRPPATKDAALLASAQFRIQTQPGTSGSPNPPSLATTCAPDTKGWSFARCIIRYPLVGSTLVIDS